MGPFLLIDKSVVRSLNPAEASALDRHFTILVNPVLQLELLSDFAKGEFSEEEAAEKIHRLMKKLWGFSRFTLHDARQMIAANMAGSRIPLGTQIPRFEWKSYRAPDGSVGMLVEETTEDILMAKWSAKAFSEEDKARVIQLRNDILEYDMPSVQKEMQEKFPENTSFKSLKEIAEFVDTALPRMGTDYRWSMINVLACFSGMSEKSIAGLQDAWIAKNRPHLEDFAPYAHFCARVLNIYFLGITAGLISTSIHSKTLIDVMYFLYLPFCHVFVSGDLFHQELFPLFARNDQTFIWGPDLKKDMGTIAAFHASLNDNDRYLFDREFGSRAPPIPDSIASGLWNEIMGPWKAGSGNRAARRKTTHETDLS